MTFVDDTRLAVRRAVREALVDIEPGDLVLVACSGGADSLALARATAEVAGQDGFRAGAIIVDHGLQTGSDFVVAQAAEHCREFGLDPVEVTRVDVNAFATGAGLEAAARDARHAAFIACAAQTSAVAVLLAHTRDDQAETVLLRLSRGSGARSLSGMAPRSGLLRRPLLELSRDEVRSTIDPKTVWEDPHNADDEFLRVRVRRDVLPAMTRALGDAVVLGLARTAESLRADADALDEWTDSMWSRCASVKGDDSEDTDSEAHDVAEVDLAVDVLADLPTAIRTRILRRAAVFVGSSPGSLTRSHVLAMDAFLQRWHGQGPLSLPGGITVARKGGRIGFRRTDRASN